MNLNDLEHAISILYLPSNQTLLEIVQQAQSYCSNFLAQYSQNLLQLLILYENPQLQNDMTKFWMLQQISNVLENQERYIQGVPSSEQKKALQQKYMSILYDNPALVLGAKHTMSKYALIYVHMIKWDFPMSWSSAFNELISLMSISQDVNLQKVYLKFIVQVFLMLDEELIEKLDSANFMHNQLANNVKDGLRDGPINEICSLIQQAITNYKIFDEITINDFLQVTAQLIDWNQLELFSQIIPLIQQMLYLKPYRRNSIKVIRAIVDKGMDYQYKIDVIVGVQYLDIMESFQMIYRDRDDNEDEEEEEFFSAISESVGKIGQWCLELFMHHEKVLTSIQHQNHYENIINRILKLSLNLLDCQRPKVGRPIVEFFSFWLQAIKKLENLNELYALVLNQLINLTLNRASYPTWFNFNTSEQSDYEEDFVKYREEMVTNIFTNVALIKPFKEQLLNIIAELLQSISPTTSTFSQAEITLYLLYNLMQSIPSDMREKAQDNIYCELMQYILRIDFLAFNHKAVTLMFLEVIIRYNAYFINTSTGFAKRITSIFFSEQAILIRDLPQAQRCIYLLLRLCEKMVHSPTLIAEERASFPIIIENTSKIINAIMTIGDRSVVLGSEDALTLYNVLGLFACSRNVDVELRKQTIDSTYQNLYQRLVLYSTSNLDLEKVHQTLKYVNIFSKGFQATTPAVSISLIQVYFQKTLEQALLIMGQHLDQPLICDQVLLYFQRCVGLQICSAVRDLNQVGYAYITTVEFGRLEVFINILSYTAATLKLNAGPLILPLLQIAFNRMTLIPMPNNDTSEIDKITLRCFSAFIRFYQQCLEHLDLNQLLHILPEGLYDWLNSSFYQHPDKSVKKMIALIFKEMMVQMTNLKESTMHKEIIAQILNTSKKNLVATVGGLVEIANLEPQKQLVLQQTLLLSTHGIFQLNPFILDDLHTIRGLAEIQLIFVMLGFGQQISGSLKQAGSEKGIVNSQILWQICEEFRQVLQPQIKAFHERYLQALKLLPQQIKQ